MRKAKKDKNIERPNPGMKLLERKERYFFFGDLKELTDIVSETELHDKNYEHDFLTEVFIGDRFEFTSENVIKIERIKS